ncbi:MAG: ORF6N domain-containing protein [Bacteroidales bacterium]|nr:ORF6N domain-containing protein [Bacteroidales bacterium]
MNDLILSKVEGKIITLRQQQVILDCDVAELYGVQTKEINQAVRNNPEKFPEGYIFALNDDEQNELVKNFDRFNSKKHSSVNLKAFTEKGLYMLATILKSPQALKFRRWRGRGNTEEITRKLSRKFLNVSRIVHCALPIMHCPLCIAHYA